MEAKVSQMNEGINSKKNVAIETKKQFSTFKIGEQYFGIDVMEVQEIVRTMKMTKIRMCDDYIKGLINLRGQIATAVDLRKLFKFEGDGPDKPMNVICNADGDLLSFMVDEIGDVVEIDGTCFETTPETCPEELKQFMCGVYKSPDFIFCVINVKKILTVLNREHN